MAGTIENQFYQAWDTERLHEERANDDYRTPFQIDRDRVLHTSAFRKLQSKTQVFWSGEYDFYRTRLTHSLEVAQIGRALCQWLLHSSDLLSAEHCIDSDLVEATCLSHDLGHPPFGHAGERSLNHFMASYGGFEGNAQTLRLLTETVFTERQKGMNPSRAFADGVLKYKSLWSELKVPDSVPENHFIYDDQHRYLDWVMDGNDFPPELTPGKTRDSFKSIECQIMDWADDTAYSLNDLADGVRAGFLTGDRVIAWAEKAGVPADEKSPVGQLVTAIRGGRIDGFIGSQIGRFVRATRLISDVNLLSGQSNRYRFRLEVDPEIEKECAVFKKLSFEVVFLTPALKQLEHKGSYMLRRLWEVMETRYVMGERIDGQDFQLLPESVAAQIESTTDTRQRARLVCDYLAGLTDGLAARLYKRLFAPGYGSIGDLI